MPWAKKQSKKKMKKNKSKKKLSKNRNKIVITVWHAEDNKQMKV